MLFTSTYLSQRTTQDRKQVAECAPLTAEQEAAELQKIMEMEGGNMDQAEMQEIVAKLRGDKSRRPCDFMQCTMPLKSLTMVQPIDGISFSFGMPLAQRLMPSVRWNFSNKKASEFELTTLLIGPGNPNNEDEASIIQAVSSSAGTLMLMGQCPLFMGIKARLETQFMNPEMYGGGVTLTKEFDDCSIQYAY